MFVYVFGVRVVTCIHHRWPKEREKDTESEHQARPTESNEISTYIPKMLKWKECAETLEAFLGIGSVFGSD